MTALASAKVAQPADADDGAMLVVSHDAAFLDAIQISRRVTLEEF